MKSWRAFALCLLAIMLGQLTDAYNIGIGKSDITGPAAEIVMMGFADSTETTSGILNRQYARAFLIEDPDSNSRIMFVHCDLMAVMQLVHQEVLAHLATKYHGLYTEQNVILHATHTHAGPGGTAGYTLYDISIFGFVTENFDKIVSGIVAAIDAAHNSVESGSIRWNKGEVTKGGNNRSLKAYLANPESERAQYPSNIDTTMRALHFFNDAGKLRGVLAFYPVHPNSLKGENHLISSDNKGYAEFLLEDELDDVVVGIGIANAGDYDTLKALIDGDSEILKGSVVANLSYVDFSNMTIQGVNSTAADAYANRTCSAILGQNFGAGTEDGRGVANITEGDLRPNPEYDALGAAIQETPQWVKDCQNENKIAMLAVGLIEPVPWVPTILPVQIVKIGQFGLAVTNFETTTMAGRRIRKSVKAALEPAGVTEVELAAISNAYAGYMTTREEYMTQHYEGASTLFGPNQLAAVQQELARVAASVVDAAINRSTLAAVETTAGLDVAPKNQNFSYVRSQPSSSYAVGGLASAVFAGAHPMNGVALVSSFCDIQQRGLDGAFTTLMTDAHWDVRYRWERYLDAESKNTCEWNIRAGGHTSQPGTYRFVHRGYAKGSEGGVRRPIKS
ncbi:hypothetical protein PHYSODRAFT_255995 [Phytophthora sojae]|uniref:Neutral ceramidase n=1 Tax=Phytophthora sojae (strain P6497) TaxID=1094619 RepID=G5A8C9_PHYSP|nr:hypothetical protein PHYSODRAFT_255995 [Phytophthora sojae]EGZ08155.1 hypothetical protein PHYSODRAFT_255995 [Phytophthora sojae]|eukprot:XP_009536327.1 hypothetical protein PHYSODRAFT_255995 [Phytophthora sojae]